MDSDLDEGKIIERVMSMGEIIWVVVSGTAVVSERGPGRGFGDQKGLGLLSSFFFGPSWGARSALRVYGLVIAFLSTLWERIIISLQHLGHVSPGRVLLDASNSRLWVAGE